MSSSSSLPPFFTLFSSFSASPLLSSWQITVFPPAWILVVDIVATLLRDNGSQNPAFRVGLPSVLMSLLPFPAFSSVNSVHLFNPSPNKNICTFHFLVARFRYTDMPMLSSATLTKGGLSWDSRERIHSYPRTSSYLSCLTARHMNIPFSRSVAKRGYIC